MAVDYFIRYSVKELLLIRDHAAPLSEFVPTVLLSHNLWKPEPSNWNELLSHTVVGCWLAAREREVNYDFDGYTEDYNSWVVILETQEEQLITIELRQVDPCGNTFTVCRPGPLVYVVNASDRSVRLDGYAYSFRHSVKHRISVEAWLDRLEKSGITRYQLLNDRGRRYWVHCVLQQFQNFISGDIPSLGNESVMLRIWEFGRGRAKSNIHSETESIMAGLFLPMKLPHNSPLSKFSVVTDRGRRVRFPAHWHERERHHRPFWDN